MTLLVAIAFALLAGARDAHAQLDTRRWISPLWGADTAPSSLLNRYLWISTPETTPVAYNVLDRAGNQVAAGNVSNANPLQIHLGQFASSVYKSKTPGAGHILIGDAASRSADVNDFNATLVAATKPIAVSSGCWLGGQSATNGQDIGVDQLAPENMGGREYVLMKGNALNVDLKENHLVLAIEEGTSIDINGSAVAAATMHAGDYRFLVGEYSPNGNMLVRADKPILMAQPIGGSTNEATLGFSFIPPLTVDSDTFVDNVANVQQIDAATLGIIARKGYPVLVYGVAIDVAA